MNAPMSKAEPAAKVKTVEGDIKLPTLDAVIAETEKVGAILPRNIEEAYRLAQAIVNSGLAPDSYKNDPRDRAADSQKVMVGIMKAMEVGLPPITGLGVIAIINNKPCIWGDGAVALIQAKGVLANMTVTEVGSKPGETAELNKFPDDYGIEVRMWRRGQTDPYVGRFTVGDAKRAKLWMHPKKQPWMLYPKRMLKWRAFAIPARDGFADCLSGLSIREEVEDYHVDAPKTVDSSFLDDGPATEPELATETSDDAPAEPEPAAEPQQADLTEVTARTDRILARLREAETEDEIAAAQADGDGLPEGLKVQVDEAADAQREWIKEKAGGFGKGSEA